MFHKSVFYTRRATGKLLILLLGHYKTSNPKNGSGTIAQASPPEYPDNKVINHPNLINSKIIFNGKNNILYCEKGVTLENVLIAFHKDNSVIYLSAGPRSRYCNLYIGTSHNSVIYIGKNTRFHKSKKYKMQILGQEQKHVIIGSESIFSLNCWVRTSDAHPIYDLTNKMRLNPGRSVLIGDHIWVAQDVTVLKGARLGSGSIIGAGSIVTGKTFQSNASYAGNPAKLVRDNILFESADVNHATMSNSKLETAAEDWVYSHDPSSTLDFNEIDYNLTIAATSDEKLAYVKNVLSENITKNRFFIGPS